VLLQPLLPSLFEPEDAEEILMEVLKNTKIKSLNQHVHIFCNTVVVTDHFIQKLTKPFDAIIQKKAEEVHICKTVSMPLYEGSSESNASYFIMLAHDVRGECC